MDLLVILPLNSMSTFRRLEEYGMIHDMQDTRTLQDTNTEENINIVRYLVWNMPRELRKKLLEIEDAEKESNEDLLRAMSYQIFEHEKPYHVAKAMAADQAYVAKRKRNAAKQKEELWTSRNFVYNLMKKGKDVSKSIGIFRSKVDRFLKKFKNHVSEAENNCFGCGSIQQES